MRAPNGPDSDVAGAVERISQETLRAYREAPRFVEEHANLERAAIEGGYGRRQLFELVQNGADEMLEDPGRVQVVLTEEALYCANQGRPLTAAGVGALLSSYRSAKKGMEIGRFGLGFKSVLGITRRPAIFSRSGSIGFDPDFARAAIEPVVGEVKRVPLLRVGRALDAAVEERHDSVLAELLSWATTVVRLRRDVGEDDWLERDLRDFPAQFLLFAPHVEELVLQDRERDLDRSIVAHRQGEEIELREDGAITEWRVFSMAHHPSELARRDGGAMADREVVPLVWAVPRRRRGIGQFWAFFPTLESTTLSGVLNAPWKLNEDRTRLIDGPFNTELLELLAALVLEHGQELCDPRDPAVFLDLMPGRGREARGEPDRVLTQAINDLAKVSPSIPNQRGELELPASIEIGPEVPREVLERWASQPTAPIAWAHPSVNTTERRATALRYREPEGSTPMRRWIEALVSAEDPLSGSAAALLVAAAVVEADADQRSAVEEAKIVLDADETLRTLGDPGLFLPAPVPVDLDTHFVHPELLARHDVVEALRVLGIRKVDAVRLLEGRLAQSSVQSWEPHDWDLFWSLARQSPPEAVVPLLERHELTSSTLKVRNQSGAWRPISSLLLPGEIVGADTDDHDVAIDTAFHSSERRLLEMLGAVRGPSEHGGSKHERFFQEYQQAVMRRYLERLKGAKPNHQYLRFSSRPFAGPLTPLASLSARGRVKYTEALLAVATDLRDWTFGHTSSNRYPDIPFRNPVAQAIRQYGIMRTSLGPRAFPRVVSPSLAELGRFLPVAQCSLAAAGTLRLPATPEALTDDHWEALLAVVAEADDDHVIGTGYAFAARHQRECPPEIRCRAGAGHDLRSPEQVVVTMDADLARVFVDTASPFVLVSSREDEEALRQSWALRSDADTVDTRVSFVPVGEPTPLADLFPMLRLRLDGVQRELLVQPACDLRVERFTATGQVSSAHDVVLHGGVLYHDADISPQGLLNNLSRHLGLGLTDAEIDAVLRNLDAQRVQRLRSQIRSAEDDASRLLAAVPEAALRSHLPRSLIEAVEEFDGPLDPVGIARLALVVHGSQVLQEHRSELEQCGLEPPQAWAGSRQAIAFVRALGFGQEYAGFPPPRVDRKLEVEGPPLLGNLHAYQEVVVEEMRELLRAKSGNRGLLSLPTGAGKTRITIEALVAAMREGELGSPILWVAQTTELCEQAVQSWSEVWRARGPRERLTLSRLWTSFEAEQVDAGHQVVVATIAKLGAGVFSKPAYDWLSHATCVVVDEAHQSIGTSYTALLEWQGMPRNTERVPVVGLTATPFRGVNVEETRRLVGRYGGRRLDANALPADEPYGYLQDLGILARVDQKTLPGSQIDLSGDELDQLARFRTLPDRPIRELARDVARNESLLEHIQGLDEDWPVLLFALSVDHAQTMAALLNHRGIPAAAIYSETDRGLRRHYVDQFRRGDLRVLTNYDVLTAGFDAPKVRALYVARPVYAPNTYQQMIGRGLRGPLNGGTDRCLLVNVADNVASFGEQLAFRHFDYLWNSRTHVEGDRAHDPDAEVVV